MTTRTLNISDEDRALLTAEELAGMEEGTEFDEGQADDAIDITDDVNAAGTKPKQDGDGDDEDDSKPAPNVDTPPAAQEDEVEPVAKPEPAAQATLYTTLPDDYDERVTSIAAAKDDLYAKFDEGDLTNAEYAKQLDDLNKQERALERVKDQAEYDQRQRYHNWVNVTVRSFLDTHTEYASNDMLTNLLDQEVRKIQGAADNDTDPQILLDAHAKIAAAFPQIFSKQEAPSQQERKPAAPSIKPTVPTLARTPAANIDQPGESKFDWLDRLQEADPLKYERELEKLQRSNEAEFNEYMAS